MWADAPKPFIVRHTGERRYPSGVLAPFVHREPVSDTPPNLDSGFRRNDWRYFSHVLTFIRTFLSFVIFVVNEISRLVSLFSNFRQRLLEKTLIDVLRRLRERFFENSLLSNQFDHC